MIPSSDEIALMICGAQPSDTLGREMKIKLDAFTTAYLECMLWSSNDESREDGGDPLDRNYSISDIEPESLARAVEDCAAFERVSGTS